MLLTNPGALYRSGAASMFGLAAEASSRRPVFQLDRVHPEDRAKVAAFPATVVREGQGCIEYRFLCGDGAWIVLRDSAVVVRNESGEPVEIVGYCLDLAEETRAGEARREKERLHLFAEALLTTQEAERKRISRELHDDLSQRLAALILDIGLLEKTLPAEQNPLRFALKALKVQAADISDSVRAIALQLHSAGLEQFGLPAALEQECAALAGRTRMCVSFRTRSVPETLPENVSLCLYRVAQECLRNVLRHSEAREVKVTLT
ncbi:MAG: PAS domain-containing protein, partial [Acidobacteriota bacterium]